MTKLFVTVFEGANATALGDPIQEEVVVIGAGSLKSAVITAAGASATNVRRVVRLYAIADCFVTWGADPTAVVDGTDGRAIGADNPEYFDIQAGHFVAVITRV